MHAFFEKNASLLLENPELAEAFQKIMTFEKYPKQHILHESGRICNHMYIIISGVARVFYYKEDKDITCHFASEQESITAIDSFIQRKTSKYNIEVLEDLEVFKIAHSDLENLFASNPKFERFGRLFLQQIYIDLVERIDDLQLKTAHERYEILLEKRPRLFLRVASKHIASYLGMTPETFSRIRAK
ncbi:Crp/Fnr family transcriptional regulator [Polaribacter haliotis]|uniref:Crp/Fnr family transcriptional regulator n=1 Tax=Polaribacter haliotis TaxID=1888915 RepID=A0A7L8AED2_9FLAO|nr:Crp/Fnr family transcriptional regulator [Polaribacter haliotis]QOD60370.1 Crp/Fnr family transcriptional regulator [Polaribacter haliotis]